MAKVRVRVCRIDPATFVTDRKAILDELAGLAGLSDEEVDVLFRELGAEPWADDPAVLDAIIRKTAARIGVIVQYEFPQ